MKRSFVVLIIFILKICLHSNNEKDNFPKILEPLRWDIKINEVKSKFSNVIVTYSVYQKIYKGKLLKVKAKHIKNLKLGLFKNAILVMEYYDGEIIDMHIYTDRDSRVWSNKYNKKLEKEYLGIYNKLVYELGTPKINRVPIGVYDKRAKEVIWHKRDYTIALFFDGGEDDFWQIQLSIQKR